MQASQIPSLIPLAFAANGTKNTIPEASQVTITNGAASLNDGFPPLTMTPVAAGGIPPSGADFNGILNLISAVSRWQNAGGQFTWNQAFTTDANVGGYPSGAYLMRADGTGFWLNTADNNETNPDATDGSAENWVPGYTYGATAISGLTNVNVTLTPAQAAKSRITLSGALTANVQIIFPAWTKQWEIVNNTTGAYSVTATTAAGTGVVLPVGNTLIFGDGTNITLPPFSIAAAISSSQAINLGQLIAYFQANALGVSAQGWADYTSSRALGATYTNTSGRPIIVNAYVLQNEGSAFSLNIEGVGVSLSNGPTGSYTNLFTVVLPGEEYGVTYSGSPTLDFWLEMR